MTWHVHAYVYMQRSVFSLYLKKNVEVRGEFTGTVKVTNTVTSALDKLDINILTRTMSLETLKQISKKTVITVTKRINSHCFGSLP